MKPALLALGSLVCFTSCSAQYKAPSRGDEALIINRPAGIASSLVTQKLQTHIEKIDGQTVGWASPYFQQYKVSPGRHVIRTTGLSRRDSSSTEIEFDFKAHQTYTLSGYTATESHELIHLYEIKDSQERIVARKSPRVVYSDRSAPIFIPISQ